MDGVERDPERSHRGVQAAQEIAVKGRGLQRIGAIARCERLEIAITLGPNRLGRLVENEELELESGVNLDSEFSGGLDLAETEIAGRSTPKLPDKIRKADRGIVRKRVGANGVGKEFRRPIDKGDVRMRFLGDVPEVEDLAERVAVPRELDRLVGGNPLIAELALEIDHADVDETGAKFLEFCFEAGARVA